MGYPTTDIEAPDQYLLSFEDRDHYLYAFVGEGEDSLGVSKDFWQRILSRCVENDWRKILVEKDLEGELDSQEIYELAVWITGLDLAGRRVAFVDRHPEHEDKNRLGELIVTNRGLRITVFRTVEEAEAWLAS